MVLLAVAVAAVALVPAAANATWGDVLVALRRLRPGWLVGLTVTWLASLVCWAGVLAAALPGLGRRRALALNLSGSAVANVLPAGGPAGIGLNYAMLRSWSYSGRDVARYTTVTNVVDVIAKLVLVAGAAAVVLAASGPLATVLPAAVPVLAAVLAVLAGLALVLLSDRAARACGRLIDQLTPRLFGLVGSSRCTRLAVTLPELGRTSRSVLRRRWLPLSLGALGYLLFQGLLLWECFRAIGAVLQPVALLAGLATERFLTMIPLTPGGSGLVEQGTVATLLTFGAPAVAVPAAVVLYRAFTYAAEIPVGAAVALGWWLARRTRTKTGRAAA